MEIGYAQTGSPRALPNAAPATQVPEKVRIYQGTLYGDGAFLSLEDVALFDGERTVRFKDGSEREQPCLAKCLVPPIIDFPRGFTLQNHRRRHPRRRSRFPIRPVT